ncbi:MAG: flagellar export protein FliJ [Phycisphaerae bacterium]|jgi:flagellar export protein FliJ
MARRFRFRLDTVHRLRQQALDQQRRAVAEARQAVARIELRIARLSAQLEQTVSGSRTVQRGCRLDVRSLSGYEFYRGWLHRKIMESGDDLTHARTRLDEARTKMAAAFKQLKVIERLRDKQWRRHRAEVEREERLVMDEAALNVYLRGREQPRSEVAA